MIIYPIVPPKPGSPEYNDLVVFFLGDEAAAAAYIDQLTSYAADGLEAQELLDAAEAAGNVNEAIAILEAGGLPLVQTYASLADVIAAALPENTPWRIAWDAGTLAAPFSAAGEVVGDIRNGDPSWVGWLPYERWGTTLSDTTATGGTRTTDSDGRPRLSVTSTSGSSVETDLGLRTDRPQRVRLLARFTAASPANGTDGEFAGVMARRVSGGTIFKNYVGRLVSIGGWYSGANIAGSTIAFPLLDSPTDTSKFNPGKNIEFELQMINGNISLNVMLAGSGLPNGETRKVQNATSLSSALGDFSSANDLDIGAYLISRGAAMSLDLLGIQISGPPTRG